MRHSLLGTVNRHDLILCNVCVISVFIPADHRFQKLVPVAQCIPVIFRMKTGFGNRLHDVLLRLKIRSAHGKIIDFPSLALQLFSFIVKNIEDSRLKILHFVGRFKNHMYLLSFLFV